LVTVTGLQETAILIEDVFAGIAGELFEGGVGIDQDVVVSILKHPGGLSTCGIMPGLSIWF
jgi:hypothetical protein